MRRLALVVPLLACTLALSLSAARADDPPTSWADPTLEDALYAARIVVRGHIQAPLAGEKEVRLAIEKVIAGEGKPGVSLPLFGAAGPPSLDALLPALRPGNEIVAILDQVGDPAKPRLELPTPSFGRFQVHHGVVAGSFRDSFVRVSVNVETYEEFLKNAWARAKGGKPDAAFIDSCRATLAALDPAAKESPAPAHVALEGLALGAEAKDEKVARRFFACSSFQIRISAARVLARAGGEEAGSDLLRLALDDQDPAVRSVAISALASVKPTPAGAVEKLLARLKDLPAANTFLHINVEDPRSNELLGPMPAAFETLRALGAGDKATPVAIELLEKDDPDTLMTGILHLAKVKARSRTAEIVEKMRPAGYPYGFSNEKIGDLLEELTGQKLGSDREAWRTYVKRENEK